MKTIFTVLLLLSYQIICGSGQKFSFGDTSLIIDGPKNIRNQCAIINGTLFTHTHSRTVEQYLGEPAHNVPFIHYARYLANSNSRLMKAPALSDIPEKFHGECWYVTIEDNGYYVHPSWLTKLPANYAQQKPPKKQKNNNCSLQ